MAKKRRASSGGGLAQRPPGGDGNNDAGCRTANGLCITAAYSLAIPISPGGLGGIYWHPISSRLFYHCFFSAFLLCWLVLALSALAGGLIMEQYAGLDVSHFSRFNPDIQAPLWWDIIGLL